MDFPQTPDFARLIAAIARGLRAHEVPFMLIGGQAVLLHGSPRLTEDVDITLGIGPEQLSVVLGVCRDLNLEPLPREVEDFVRETFVLPARDEANHIRVDFIFSNTPYEHSAIRRAISVELSGTQVPFASAEDLLIHKLFASRPRDLEDALQIIRRNRDKLDWEYLRDWTRAFAAVPGREAMPQQLEDLRAQAV